MEELFQDQNTPKKIAKELGNVYSQTTKSEVSLLKYSENLTYLVKDRKTQNKYVLRLYRMGYHDPEEMLGELKWIHQLKKDVDIRIPSVYAGKDGKLIQNIHLGEENQQEVFVSLFEYIEGHTLRELTLAEIQNYIEKIGEITAQFHLHALGWEESSTLNRFSWDFESLIGRDARWGKYDTLKVLKKEEKSVCERAVHLIKKRIEQYGKSKERYGLIHSDLNLNNVIVQGEEIYVIDFDDCGYGWFLYDLATTVLEFFNEELITYIEKWKKGYQKYRHLAVEDEAEIMTFVLLRKIVRLGWIATHQENDTVKGIKKEYYDQTIRLAIEYVEKYSF